MHTWLPLSDFSHISCHLTYPDFFAASFTSPKDITGGKLSFSLASWVASSANLSACSLPLMFACPGVQEISMIMLAFSCCLIIFLLHVLYFGVICTPILKLVFFMHFKLKSIFSFS